LFGSRRVRVTDIAEVWRSNLPWRDDFVFWASRELSKTGSLAAHADTLRELGGGISRTEAVWLFSRLQEAGRPESEWRAEFVSLFPQVGLADLPPLW
jgi:hypothetical protein